MFEKLQIFPYMFLHLAGLDFYLHDKTLALPWILWITLENYKTWENPQICSQLALSVGGLGTLELVAGVWSEDTLVGHCAFNLWSWPNLGC